MHRFAASHAIAAFVSGGCTTTHRVRRPDTFEQLEPLQTSARYRMTLLHERPPGATSSVPPSLALGPGAPVNGAVAPMVDLSNLRGYRIKRRGAGALEGLGLGSLIGAATGVALGFAAGDDPKCMNQESNCYPLELSAGDKALLFGVIGVLAGGLIGTVVGAAVGHQDEYLFWNPGAQR
jgi:hypothetical protein